MYRLPEDLGEFTDAGMTDPEVGRRTFEAVVGRPPARAEFARLMERRLHHLYTTVADSKDYRVLAGVEQMLPRLIDGGYLLGLVTGNVEAAAHIKLHRARLNRFFSFGGYGSDSSDRSQLTRRALERAALVHGEPIDPKQSLAFGDTPHDVTGAHGAGLECVGVASGHFTLRQLREAGADYVVESLAENLPL